MTTKQGLYVTRIIVYFGDSSGHHLCRLLEPNWFIKGIEETGVLDKIDIITDLNR